MSKAKNTGSNKSKDAYLTHDEMRELLAGKPGREFVLQTTFQLYNWAEQIPSDYINYRVFRELTVRYYRGEKNRFGDEKADDYRFDAVILVEPGYRALARRQVFSIGVELKGDVNDLKRDDKIQMYQGWTDFFYIGVPDELADAAMSKAKEVMKQYPETADKIGVFGVESGQIYMIPTKRIEVPAENRIAVQQQIIYNYCMKEDKVIVVDCKDVKILPLPALKENPRFVNISTTENNNVTADTAVDAASDANTSTNAADDNSAQIKPQNAEKNTEIKNNTLTDAERRERAEKRAENRAKVKELKHNLQERAEVLLPETREKLASLSDRDNVVFWTIRDAQQGIDATELPRHIGQSSASITRSIAVLRKSGLIELDGGRKYGKFKACGNAALDSRCMTCEFVNECHGNALLCKTYVARNSAN